MPVFEYEALATGRRAHSGTVTAETPRVARDLLRARGLVIERLVEHRPAAARRWSLGPWAWGRARGWGWGRGGRLQLASFFRGLSTLLAVGVPLTEALETLARQHRRRGRVVLEQLRDRVSAGATLASAMGEHARVFDAMCLQVTRVGEDAGTLETSLARLANHLERSRRMRGKLATALIYPGLVLGTAAIVTVFLMTFVVPNIIEPLQEMGRPLPLPTRLVKGASDLAIAWGWAIGLAGFAGGAGFLLAVRTSRGRWAWHAGLLRLPLLGELIRKQAVVQVAVTMSTLMKSGIVFVAALQSARRATRNVVLAEALGGCERAVTAGSDVGPAMEKTRAFPPVVVQVFAVGQQSGRLEEMLDRLAEDYDEEVSAAAQRLAAVLEPTLILLLALIVLTIAMATMLPILEAGNALE